MEPPEFQSQEVGHIEDWTAPIHDLWDSPHIGIHIRTNSRQAVVGESITASPLLTAMEPPESQPEVTGNMNDSRDPIFDLHSPRTNIQIGTNDHQAVVGESNPADSLLTPIPPGSQRSQPEVAGNWEVPIPNLHDSPLTSIHIGANDHQAVVGESNPDHSLLAPMEPPGSQPEVAGNWGVPIPDLYDSIRTSIHVGTNSHQAIEEPLLTPMEPPELQPTLKNINRWRTQIRNLWNFLRTRIYVKNRRPRGQVVARQNT